MSNVISNENVGYIKRCKTAKVYWEVNCATLINKYISIVLEQIILKQIIVATIVKFVQRW